MKFIEFFGMPASGKTYIVKNLEKNSCNHKKLNLFFAFDKRSKITFFKKIYYLLIATILYFNFSYLKTINFFINTYRPRRSRKISLRTLSIIFNTFFLLSLISIYNNSKKNINLFLDQGFLQMLFSILYEMNLRNRKERESLIKYWFEIFSLQNQNMYLFYCESDYSLLLKRLLIRRGDSIIEKNKVKKSDLKLCQNIFDSIIEFILAREDSLSNLKFQRVSSDIKNINLLKLL